MNPLLPIIWFLPAYVANATATFSRFFPTVHPVDGGRVWKGKRVLGDGKTWEGFLLGIFFGTLTGWLVSLFLHIGLLEGAVLMSIGALTGDMVGSFIKRRMGMPRGAEAPLLDQLDFVIGAFLFYPPPPDYGIVILVVTPIIHRLANIIGHSIGVKREPW